MTAPKGPHTAMAASFRCPFWPVEIASQGDAVAVVEGDFAVVHLIAFGEGFVPFLGEGQRFVHGSASFSEGMDGSDGFLIGTRVPGFHLIDQIV